MKHMKIHYKQNEMKKIKANGKLLHNGGGERVHKHTLFPCVCVCLRESAYSLTANVYVSVCFTKM